MFKFINLILSFLVIVLGGLTFQHLFNWIPAEVFDIKNITFTQAVALSIFVELLQFRTTDIEKVEKETEKEKLERNIIYLFCLVVFLGIGYLISFTI